MFEKLFKENTEQYTNLGNEVSDDFYEVIKTVFDKYKNRCSSRDLENIIHAVTSTITIEFIFKRSFDLRKMETESRIKTATDDPNLIQKIKELAFKFQNETNNSMLDNTLSKLQMIKACRDLTGLSLKESTNWIEDTFSFDNYGLMNDEAD